MIPSVRDIGDVRGKRVLVRADLNVPIVSGVPADDFRLQRIVPTLSFLREKGARILVVSHHSDRGQSLQPVANRLSGYVPVSFAGDVLVGGFLETLRKSAEGSIFVGENLRFHSGEEKNDLFFGKQLASLGDFFVNDDFAVSHRAHASVVTVPTLLPSFAGISFMEELEHLNDMFDPPHPFLFILGGGKAGTKLPLVKKFLAIADHIFIGGAPANNFFQGLGYEIGRSLADEPNIDILPLLKNPKIILPEDVVVSSGDTNRVTFPTQVVPEEKISDAGPKTIALLQPFIQEAHLILWNGPLGEYEREPFDAGSVELARSIAESGVRAVVGGGDTVALLGRIQLVHKFSFVSTAGGAMLQFLTDGTLPGIEALKK